MPETTIQSQDEVIAFLKSGRAFAVPGPVVHVQTHGAHVFLGVDVALKIKRAVRYDYLDQSTPDLRRALLDRELALNQRTAPMVYRDVVPVTRRTGGGLEIDGTGPPVEWVLRMNRFAPECEMTAVAASHQLTDPVADALGRAVHQFHATCPVVHDAGDDLIREILDELDRVLTPFRGEVGHGCIEAFLGRASQDLSSLAPHLRERSATGHVKRVHGDLHLKNILLIEGKPVLFDALEFDERLATCDVLYDLAFLLMDLCHRGLHRQASVAMAAYLLAAAGAQDAGLAALPLFMAVRAAIRAMVLLQTDQATGRHGASSGEAVRYLTEAVGHLNRTPPVLIAVGGMSGTGKTVLAQSLAPDIGSCPGAVHLLTDSERKTGAPQVDYAPPARRAVYDRMFARAESLLAAGRCVVLDATFLEPAHRTAVQMLAARAGVGFCGLWLTAPQPVLIERVSLRRGDASDADADVVKAQSRSATPAWQEDRWVHIDASGGMQVTRDAASTALASVLGTLGKGRTPGF